MRRISALLAATCLATVAPAMASAASDSSGVDIASVDTSAYPNVSMDIAVPGGLTNDLAASLTVTENGAALTPQIAPISTKGLEVVMLLDVSGSMKEGNAIAAAKNAALGFLDALPPEVMVGVVSFGDTTHLDSPLTADRVLLSTVINNLSAHGETSLYDAMVFAQTLFSGETADRQLVVLSDGGDTVSHADLSAATAVAADIQTNVIELTSSEANRAALEQLVSAHGGSLDSATDPAALQGLYARVASAIVNRYRITFESQAHGSVSYRVAVVIAAGELSDTTTAQLPEAAVVAPPPPSNEGTSAATATTTPAVAVTVPADAAAATPVVASSPSGGQTIRLVIGASALFLGLTALMLLALPFTGRRRSAGRDRLGTTELVPSGGNASVASKVTNAAERLLERRGHRRGLAQALEVAGINLRPGEFFVLAIAGGAVLALVLFGLFGVVGLVAAAIAAPLAARAYVQSRVARRRRAFGQQLPDVLQLMVSSLRAGYGLPQTIDAIASQADEPARSELRRVLLEGRIGRDPTEALQAVADRMDSSDFQWVVAAFDINRSVGGELAVVLENIAETVRERQRLSRQVLTLTAEGRLSAYILTALPIFLAAVIKLASPDYFHPFSKSPGPALLILSCVLMVSGWVWMHKLVRSKF